jgi:hypothetical protein
MDERCYRLAELRLELAVLNAFGQPTKPGSPERWAVLAELEPLLGALFALIEELEVDPIIPVFL